MDKNLNDAFLGIGLSQEEIDKMLINGDWKMFCNEHPENHSTIDIILASMDEINNVEFDQKFLYKDGQCLGSCAMARFWK